MNPEDIKELYRVLVNPDFEVTFAFPAYLFNEPFYVQKQPGVRAYTFYLLHPSGNFAEARFTLFVQDKAGFSPCRAPYGSFEFSPDLRLELLNYFIEYVTTFARELALQQIRITSYPFGLAPEAATLLTTGLMQQGYQISVSELNYHVSISPLPFEAGLHESEKRRLKKCVEAGFTFAEETAPDLKSVHAFIKSARSRRGFPMSLDLESFQRLFYEFPGVYRVFTVRDGDEVVALTVTVDVNAQIIYNFYPADDINYLSYSPTVFLLKGVYEHSRKRGFSILDLGIATDGGAPNYGLIRFKHNLGGVPSLKFTFTRMVGGV
jgi:hypothetical protein